MAKYRLGTYVWWWTAIPTPRWFDDNDFQFYRRHPRVGGAMFRAWGWLRSRGLIQMRRTPN